MKKFDIVYNKIIKEDAEERAWEYRQIQDAAKKAKAAKKKGQKVSYSKLADEYGVSAGDIKKACNEGYVSDRLHPHVKRHPILDDKDRLENILHDLELIAYEKHTSEEGRKNLLAAQELVVKVANEFQRTISQTNLYPKKR